MKRPLLIVGFSFAITMLAAFLLDGKAALLLSGAALVSGVLAYLLDRKRPAVAVAFFAAACAMAVYTWHYTTAIEPFLIAGGQRVTVEGLVEEVRQSGRAVDYTVDASFPKAALPDTKVQIRAYGEAQAFPGDVIRCRVELADSVAGYLLSQGIRAKGMAVTPLEQVESEDYVFARWRLALRRYLETNLYEKLPPSSADVVATLSLKLGPGVASGVYAHMNRSGISHLLSISGLHFSILAAFLLGLFRLTSLPRRVPELLTIACGFLFVVITGFSPSILRAFAMFLVMMAGQLSYRRSDSLNSLGFAVLVIAALRPQWTQSLGLWLSALSTKGIMVLGQRFSKLFYQRLWGHSRLYNRLVKAICDGAGISLGAYLFTMPLLMISNGWISLVALPANILITPFTTPMLLGGLVCAIIPGTAAPLRAVARVTDLCTRIVLELSRLLSKVPFSTISLDHAWMLLWLAGVAVIALLLLCVRSKQFSGFAVMLCLCSFGLCSLSQSAAARDQLELITLADCGPAILLRESEAVLLGAPNRYEAATLLDYLDFRGIKRVSALIVTDSGGVDSGLLQLAAGYSPGIIVGPDDAYMLELLAQAMKGTPVYASGYATTQVLDAALIHADKPNGTLTVTAATKTIRKAPGEEFDGDAILLHENGTVSLPGAVTPLVEPVGERLFGETRIVIELR